MIIWSAAIWENVPYDERGSENPDERSHVWVAKNPRSFKAGGENSDQTVLMCIFQG